MAANHVVIARLAHLALHFVKIEELEIVVDYFSPDWVINIFAAGTIGSTCRIG